jgi:hypothetical protein
VQRMAAGQLRSAARWPARWKRATSATNVPQAKTEYKTVVPNLPFSIVISARNAGTTSRTRHQLSIYHIVVNSSIVINTSTKATRLLRSRYPR